MSVLILGLQLGEGAFADHGEIAGGLVENPSPCLCAQRAPGWTIDRPLTADEWVELARHADAKCPWCHGTAREVHQTPRFYLSWSADTVWRLRTLLGLEMHEPIVPLALARRRLMVAHATFERVAPTLVREEQLETASLEQPDGTVQLHAVRFYQPPLDVAALKHRLDLFESFVRSIAEAGATHVMFDGGT